MADEVQVLMAYWDRQQVLNDIGNTESLVVPYFVFNVEDETAALAAAYANTPSQFEAGTEAGVTVYVDRKTIEIDSRVSEHVWKVRVNYPKPDYSNDETQTSFTFDTTGSSMHMDVALQHMGDYAASGETNIPNYNGAINVDKDGEVKGIDITQPKFSFTIGKIFSDSRITDSFKRNVSDKTGCVNDSTFEGWAAGEVLFQGVTGSRRGQKSTDKWELIYHFDVSRNATNLQIGDITIPSKKGWEYLWFSYRNVVEDGLMLKKPYAAHLEQVYFTTSFNGLW